MVEESIINLVLVGLGEVMVTVGVISDVIAALGMLRFPNFFVRLHAATVGTIWGAFLPLIGASLIAAGSEFLGQYRWFMSGGAIVTAILILILAPAGSHALARAAYRSKSAEVRPKSVDHLSEFLKRKAGGEESA